MYQIQQQVTEICVACEQDLQEQFKKTYRMMMLATNITILALSQLGNSPIHPCPDAISC